MSTNTRNLAALILRQVIKDGLSLTSLLSDNLAALPDPRDRAFTQALCYGVLRHYSSLQAILDQLASKPIKDEDIRMLALIGIYQLRDMAVKPYAAVAATVDAAKRKRWAQPLLNAILRNYVRQQDSLESATLVTSAIRFSHPDWLVSRITRDWPESAQAILEANNAAPPMTLRINTQKVSRSSQLETLQTAGLPAKSCEFSEEGLILQQACVVEQIPGFKEGWVSVQDEAAQLAAELLAAEPGHRVLDVCAAPGGKTLHILERCDKLAEVIAVDIDPHRLQRIQASLDRCELKATLCCGDAAAPSTWWDGHAFDRLLLDAPCSATGVIRRHPDIKWLRQSTDIPKLEQLQARILDAVWPTLRKGGRMLYATCSILRAENEDQMTSFLARHPDAHAIELDKAWGLSRPVGRQILPGQHGMDGFYYALIEKAT